MEKKSLSNSSYIIPIRNEKNNVTIFINFFDIFYKDYELIFVYDLEEDSSLEELHLLKKNFKGIKIIFSKITGIGPCVNEGLKHLSGSRKYVGILISDDLGPVFVLKEIEQLLNHNLSRYTKGGCRSFNFPSQYIMSYFSNKLLQPFYGTSDSTTACRFAAKETFYKISEKINEKSWSFNIEFLKKIKKNNLRLIEVPIKSYDYGAKSSTYSMTGWIVKYIRSLLK